MRMLRKVHLNVVRWPLYPQRFFYADTNDIPLNRIIRRMHWLQWKGWNFESVELFKFRYMNINIVSYNKYITK